MRTLKLALAAAAAFALNANADSSLSGVTTKVNGMGAAPSGTYQTWSDDVSKIANGTADDKLAFHAGGVAACDGCHVMHNAGPDQGGAKATLNGGNSVAPWSNVTNVYLLQGSDQSSTCLICHGSSRDLPSPDGTGTQFTVFDADAVPSNRTPGGDFGWLQLGFANSPAARHGHNVVAADFGLSADLDTMKQAPGGSFVGGTGRKAFACSSCHDPHGRYRMQTGVGGNGVQFVSPGPDGLLPADALPIAASGSYGAEPSQTYAVGAYRLLAGQRYAPASNPATPFPNDPPVAVAPKAYNKTEANGEVRVAYGTGMSEWCQNCHTNIHLDGYTSGVAGLRHPAGSDALLHAGQIQVYNAYISSGKMTGGTATYTSLVPFEQGKDVTRSILFTNASTGANVEATATSAVMCLSCHRAHASAFDSMVRWDQNATFLTDSDSGTEGFTAGITNAVGAVGTARSTALTQAGYYDRDVGAGNGTTQLGHYQRSLCNKCHGKD